MAISQHQFYLDRKQSKSKIHAARSLNEIAIDLTETGTLKTSKLANMGSKGKIISGSSGSLLSSGSQESDSSQTAKKDMLAALRARQEALEETLRQRIEELKSICIREAELTGRLPKEYPLDPGEEPPTVRRKIGTAFKLDEQKILPKGEEEELERLEREFAIQSQITEAARRLASDPHVSSKKLRKQRKASYLNALKKLQDMENAINEHRIRSGKKPTQRASLIIEDDPQVTGTPTFSPVSSPHKGLPPRPPCHSRPPPPQSLEGLRHLHYQRSDYDKSPIKPRMWSESSLDEPYERVKKRPSHSRSAHGSSVLMLLHYFRSHSLGHSLSQPFRGRSSSLESQGKLLNMEAESDAGLSPELFLSGPQRAGSNGSVAPDDCSSCTSHSSSEHYYPPSGANPNYCTLAEDSPSKARQRQRQRHKSAGHLGASSSGSMPNLAARNGAAHAGMCGSHQGVYLHSQSQPSSQYRIKEYPLYTEGGSPSAVVVRSLESDQEGHYSVKAQFKTSNSYTAGGLYKEGWGSGEDGEGGGSAGGAGGGGRLTPSRSQIVRTPSLGREGGGGGGGRAAVSEELRCWYQRSSGSLKEHSRVTHTGSNAADGRVGRVGTLAKCSPGETHTRARTHTHTHTHTPAHTHTFSCIDFLIYLYSVLTQYVTYTYNNLLSNKYLECVNFPNNKTSGCMSRER
uniref:Cytohesin Ubiquitin Protein Inducing domain-containing protein n=1 Tax=Electrophorus electricus TaxID=8005 RepID=A0AAY5EBN5_ELEEL